MSSLDFHHKAYWVLPLSRVAGDEYAKRRRMPDRTEINYRTLA